MKLKRCSFPDRRWFFDDVFFSLIIMAFRDLHDYGLIHDDELTEITEENSHILSTGCSATTARVSVKLITPKKHSSY